MTTPPMTRAHRRRTASPEAASTSDGRADGAWRIWGAVRSVILTAAAGVGILSVLVFGASFLFGVRPLVVLSGSMEPTIPVGSVVFSRTVPAAELSIGDIATLDRPRGLGLITHRVVSVRGLEGGSAEIVMRGDANAIDDPQPYTAESAGRYVFHLPYIGTVAMMLRTGYGVGFAVAAILILAVVFLLDPSRLRRPPTAPLGGGAEPASAGRGLDGPARGGVEA